MDRSDALKHEAAFDAHERDDPRYDAPRLNRMRLLLVWTSRDGLFQLDKVAKPTSLCRVPITGPPLTKEKIAPLFPPGVEYSFASGERKVYNVKLASALPRGFEQRLVAAAFTPRLVAAAFGPDGPDGSDGSDGSDASVDAAYAVVDAALYLFLGETGRKAAAGTVDRLVSAGGVYFPAPEGAPYEAVVRKPAISQGERKELKLLLDVITAVGVFVSNDARTLVVNCGGVKFDKAQMSALAGCEIAKMSTQTLGAKQGVLFPQSLDPPAADDAPLFRNLPLGAMILSAISSGYSRNPRLEFWVDPNDHELGRHEYRPRGTVATDRPRRRRDATPPRRRRDATPPRRRRDPPRPA